MSRTATTTPALPVVRSQAAGTPIAVRSVWVPKYVSLGGSVGQSKAWIGASRPDAAGPAGAAEATAMLPVASRTESSNAAMARHDLDVTTRRAAGPGS